MAAGYFKGWFDIILMRILEAISAIPVLIVALLAIAALDGQSSSITVGVIGFVFAPNIARTVRAAVLSEAELEYVAAARLRAERTPHILFKEILPNVLPPIIVEFTVRLGYAIFAIATLSFLGAGVEAG